MKRRKELPIIAIFTSFLMGLSACSFGGGSYNYNGNNNNTPQQQEEEVVTHTVKFVNDDGQTPISEIQVKDGGDIRNSPYGFDSITHQYNYYFAGWLYFDENIGEQRFWRSDSDKVSKDIVLEACFINGLRISNGVLTSVNPGTKNVVIDENIIGERVHTIQTRSFENCLMDKVVFGEGVETIQAQAFINCQFLKEIVFGGSVAFVEGNPMEHDFIAIDFSFKGTLRQWVRLSGKQYLKNITLYLDGDENETVDISFPSGVENIPDYALYRSEHIKTVTIPEGVKTIGNYAFSGCTSLTSITIPSTIENIGTHAFEGCRSLKSIDLPSGLTVVKAWVFSGCSSLTSIILPDSVVTIEEGAFAGCTGLNSLLLNEGLKTIGSYAFSRINLTNLVIPNSVENMVDALNGASMRSFTFDSPNVPELGKNGSITNLIIGDRIEVIPDEMFSKFTALQTVTFGANVKTVGDKAFCGCSALKSVVMNNKIETIGEKIFEGCKGLNDLTVPFIGASVTNQTQYILSYFFGYPNNYPGSNGNKKMTEEGYVVKDVTLLDSCTTIYSVAFSDLTYLSSVTFSKNYNGPLSFSNTHIVNVYFDEENENYASVDGIVYNKAITELIYVPYKFGQIKLPSTLERINASFPILQRYNTIDYITIPRSVNYIDYFPLCNTVAEINTKYFFEGSKAEWEAITFTSYRETTNLFYYSEGEPIGFDNYWHYVNGEPHIW